ncbi:hypothetical protein ASZ78_001647 [Callipepla squamata]|uniref:Uncharacterized protein n=1 Tax=Callipepla squamata TaxID=9009 RepID=A0A226M6Z3_CALSU|nr:hypothetical protein ASZ78_001647 [Callipepla squamata]
MWEDHPLSCSHLQVSPELLQPLVTVVATLGKLGPIPGDISLGEDVGSLLTFSSGVRRAMMHPDGNATLLRCALGATKEQPGAPTAFTDSWRKAVTAVKDIWAKLQEDAARLRDACRTVVAAGATTEASKGHLVETVTQEDKALKGLMADTRVVALPSEVTEVAEVVAAHDAQVAEARDKLQAASKATEEAAKERGQHAAVAHGQLVAACMGACNYYSPLPQGRQSHVACHYWKPWP